MTAIQRFAGIRGRLPQSGRLAIWCAFALALVIPGSFVIVLLIWLARRGACKGPPAQMTFK